uniref:Reverse transcriptase domain-containing protein n=1 Tax=Tanacetum cinerariifolium TaxID=118510 RepID=A0A6L2JIK0_TANCI|nr:reverse transcriptase domain-containing protein [Tanacetum cinerariifolium]
MTEMFIDEHALDYSSPLLYDEYDDDLFEVESATKYVYDDPFDSKGEKIKESKLLIDELDLLSDFIPSSEYDSFPFEDFFKVDALPSTKNKDKDFDPPLYELSFFKEVPSPENKKIERCIYGLALQIRAVVAATEPTTIQSVVLKAGMLTDEAIRNGSLKKNTEKRGNDRELSRKENVRDDNKRSRTGMVFATITNPVRKEYTGTTPKCTNCSFHNNPEIPCCKCTNCNRLGHFARDYRMGPRMVTLESARNPTTAREACFECGGIDHYKAACPRLNRAPRPGGNHQDQPIAIEGGQCHKNNGNQARRGAFIIGAKETLQDPNIVTGSQDPLPHDKILRVLVENLEGKVRYLMSAKIEEPKLKDIVVVRNFPEEAPRTPSEVRLFLGLAGYYRRFIENFCKIAKLVTILTQKNKPYVWGKDQEEAFQILKDELCNALVLSLPNVPEDFIVYYDASGSRLDALSRKERMKPRTVRAMNMTIQLSIKDMTLAAPNEASKVVDAPGEMLDRYWWPGMKKDIAMYSLYIKVLQSTQEALRTRDVGTFIFLLVKFSYNNNYHSSVRCALFEAIYERKCRSPILWAELGEGQLIGPKIMQETTKKISHIKDRLKATRDRQKIYADKRRKPLEFSIKMFADQSLHVPLEEIQVDAKLNFVEEPVEILEKEFKKLKRSRIPIVKGSKICAMAAPDVRRGLHVTKQTKASALAPKRVVNKVDKGMGGSSRADDEEVSPKTAPSVGKKNVSMARNSLKTTSKTNALTSVSGIFSLSNSFEALSLDNLGTEEVNKASTFGLMEGKCVIVNDEGNPLEMVDYSGEHGSENEVEHVDNEIASFLASKPSGVGYGTNILLEQWKETHENTDYDHDPYNDDMYEG